MHTLYVGLDAPSGSLHVPLIEIIPKQISSLPENITHFIITSKTTVRLMHSLLPKDGKYLSVGNATSLCLKELGIKDIISAKKECQEGIIEEIKKLSLEDPHFYYPHSSLARPALIKYLDEMGYRYTQEIAYETHFKAPFQQIDFSTISDIHFSSPSTVDAFFHFFGKPQEHIRIHAIGPVTQERIQQLKT